MGLKENIKKKRKEMNMTLEELALKVNTTRQTIHKYESGLIENIPSDRIEKLAEVLNTTPSYLMGWETSISNINKIKLLEYFDKLNEAGENEAVKIVKELTHFEKYVKNSENEISNIDKEKEIKDDTIALAAFNGNGVEHKKITPEMREKADKSYKIMEEKIKKK